MGTGIERLDEEEALRQARWAELREHYLINLPRPQQLACINVKLFICAIGRAMKTRSDRKVMNTSELHQLFPGFAGQMYWRTSLYKLVGGKCRAVSIYLWEDRKVPSGRLLSSPWIHPERYDDLAPWRVDNHIEREELLACAQDICEIWTA